VGRPLVVVAGLPRSGTSWIGRTLANAPGFSYFREPDNNDYVTGAEHRFRWLYLPSGGHDDAYEHHMRRALAGEISTPFTRAQDRGPLLSHVPRAVADRVGARLPALYLTEPGLLVKLIASTLALEWISDTYPDARLVVVVRHPCGTMGSWQRQGWPFNPEMLLRDERLVADHLAPYVDVIDGASETWERAGALWAAIMLVVARQAERHQRWVVVQHEWLCGDPAPRFRRLYDRLGLTWTADSDRFVSESDQADDEVQSMRRSARDEIDRWKHELHPAEIAACRRVVERFDLPWYPGFEPVTDDPDWAR